MTPTDSFERNPMSEAHEALRCQHIKLSGKRCGAPALRGRRLCYFHDRMLRPKRRDYALPPVIEDSSSLQFALMQVLRALQDKAHDPKTCGLMLYSLQIAASNLKGFTAEHSTPASAPAPKPKPASASKSKKPDSSNEPSLAEILLGSLALGSDYDRDNPQVRIRSAEDYYKVVEERDHQEHQKREQESRAATPEL